MSLFLPGNIIEGIFVFHLELINSVVVLLLALTDILLQPLPELVALLSLLH